jgi:hypothetical protein
MKVHEDSRSRPNKRWMDCVKDDMRIKGVNMEMTKKMAEKNMVCQPH